MSDKEFGFDVTGPVMFYNVHHPDGYHIRNFEVSLPHSCDEWIIASAPNREDAIAELMQFIDQAEDALAKLREIEPTVDDRRELGPESQVRTR